MRFMEKPRLAASSQLLTYLLQERPPDLFSSALYQAAWFGPLKPGANQLQASGWVLLQHHLFAFLQPAQHFSLRAIRDADVDRDLPHAIHGMGVGHLHVR